jgi:nucleoside 2-deoxyribosyltransferase
VTATEIQSFAVHDDPGIYLACPLTCLTENTARRRQINSDIAAAKRAIDAVTVGDRLTEESWPVSVYAPIDHSAPWKRDGLTPEDVYRKNLDAIHASDALIAFGENGASAGVGQELEWAIRLGIPILYLTSDRAVSRQIQGAPAFLRTQSYGDDSQTLENHVKNFLRLWQPMILDGPRRRASRRLRYTATTKRLRAAWQSCPNPTEVAAQVRVDIRYLELALSDPIFVSVMPAETLITLAHELDVPLTSHSPSHLIALPVPALRALLAAAEAHGWPDRDVERLIVHGRAASEADTSIDLTTKAGWQSLYGSLGSAR